MKVDTSQEDLDFENTLKEVGKTIHGVNIDVVVPVLMSLLCSCAEFSNMKPEKLIMFFIASVHAHFAIPDDESIH
jgi:hypothetical protein